jgi:hypothetical protein
MKASLSDNALVQVWGSTIIVTFWAANPVVDTNVLEETAPVICFLRNADNHLHDSTVTSTTEIVGSESTQFSVSVCFL